MQHQAAWRRVELLHTAPCYVRLSINMAQISRLRKKKTFREIRRFCHSKHLRGLNFERKCRRNPEFGLEIEQLSSSFKPEFQTDEEAPSDSEYTKSGTLGSKTSVPKSKCHPIPRRFKLNPYHHVVVPPNSQLSKARFSTTTRKRYRILDSTLGEFHGKLFVIMNML